MDMYNKMSNLNLFIGSNSENKDFLIEEINYSIEKSLEFRKYYNSEQPLLFDESFLQSDEYKNTKKHIHEKNIKLCNYLKDSVHFESLTYQSQMNADLLIPGIIGNIAGLMYNQNNVVHQGSPKTTLLEHALIIDLIRMVGFDIPDQFKRLHYELNKDDLIKIKNEKDIILPFGHITSGGSLSNFEACWTSLWVKFIPLAIKSSIENNYFKFSKNIEIKLLNGEIKTLLSMSSWELLNIDSDESVKLPFQISIENRLKISKVYEIIKKFHSCTLGLHQFIKNHKINNPVIIIPRTAHYSFEKSITSLGLGKNSLITINVDLKGRMLTTELYEQLLNCHKNKIPVINIISLLGSTQESSVDDIEEILSIKNQIKILNFHFDIHVDAAYGGYYLSLLKSDYLIENPLDDPNLFSDDNSMFRFDSSNHFDSFDPLLICSNYLKRQLKSVRYANTVSIDQHKTGYTPYSCSAILYRNSKFKDILSVTRNYIGNHSLSLGVYSIEGSRGGHSVTSAYLNHCVIRTSKSGYGNILKKCLLNSKLYIFKLLFLTNNNNNNNKNDNLFTIFQIGFDNKELLSNDDKMNYFKNQLLNNDYSLKPIDEISKNEKLLLELSEIGLDLGVLCFVFNFKCKNGETNHDYQKFIKFNETIMKRFHYTNGPKNELILSNTYLDSQTYNQNNIDSILKSIEITDNLPTKTINNIDESDINFNDDMENDDSSFSLRIPTLRVSVTNPYLYKYLDKTMEILKKEINLISKDFQ